MVKLSPYWKTVVASLAPVLATVQSLTEDGALDLSDGLTIGAALLIALGVWRVPNKTE